MRVGVDVGGTFTDLVALADGRVYTAKAVSYTHLTLPTICSV